MTPIILSIAALLQVAAPQAAPPAPAPAPAPAPTSATAPADVPVLPVTVVARYPHDPKAFTEGLVWHGDALFESIGREGESEVRRVDVATGRVIRRARIPAAQFGEGLAAWKNELVSLTWHDGIAYRWSVDTLRRLGTLRYTGEGWGLASDGTHLLQSDGSSVIRFRDPATLAPVRQVTVTLRGRPVRDLNELEVVDGQLLANVWHTPFLLRIDPATGVTTAIIDLRPIAQEIAATDPEAVANGIAWDPARRRLFVTGKLWPTLYEIRLPADPAR